MGLPTADGPDYIINKLRDDVTVPWARPIAAIVAVLWVILVLGPWLFADFVSTAMFLRWTVIALVALLVAFGLPALRYRERTGPVVGLLVGAVAMVALVWVATA